MKRIWSLLIVLCLLLLSPAAAADGSAVVDHADLLTDSQESALEAKAQEITQRYDMDVVILTVDSTDGHYIEGYADDYYDSMGYGVGADYSGVLLMLAMDTREWAISTCGDGIYAMTDYAIETTFYAIAPDLSQGAYFDAFDRYLDELDFLFRAWSDGSPVDGYAPEYDGPGSYTPGTSEDVVYHEEQKEFRFGKALLISLVIGAAVGGIALLIMKSGMKSAKPQSGAAGYLTGEDVQFLTRQDFYLYSRTTRTAIPQNRSGGPGGGSGIHRSSGGRSHGGGHGRF